MHEVVVIGAGFSGLAMGIALKKAGIQDFVILEAEGEVGGTWRDNTYPGCACDVPSHLYSYSFEPNPAWSRDYSPQPEIFDYLKHCAVKYALVPHIRFEAKVVRATFDEMRGTWTLSLESGEELVAKVVVAGTGPFSRPKRPSLPGLERFRGITFHSARWDHDFDARGKRIATVGTGASAIQFVPELAKTARHLSVFQRTPPWVLPKVDAPFQERTKRALARHPSLDRLFRASIYFRLELRGAGFVVDPRIIKMGEWMAKRHLAASIDDRSMREALTPRYAIGCKRILFSNDYFPALAKPHVSLVTSPIVEVREHAIVTGDGKVHEVDAIVLGTGFDVGTTLFGGPVTGLGGSDLDAAWAGGAEAYLGLAVAGFPNLFLLLGPNSGLGHNSIVFMIEAQVHYVLGCLERMRRDRLERISVKAVAQRRFNQEIERRMPRTVWSTGCMSWYLDRQGKNATLWPGFTLEYWWRTRRMRDADFELVSASDSPYRARERTYA